MLLTIMALQLQTTLSAARLDMKSLAPTNLQTHSKRNQLVNMLTTYDLEQHLATKQLQHYLTLKIAAAGTSNKTEYRRCLDQIENLTTEHGIDVLRQAQDEYYVQC
jgi:hypothetical protein